MSKSKVIWGFLLIVVGVVALLINMNIIGFGIVSAAIAIWPIFIIAFGLGIIFKKSGVIQLIIWIAVAAILIYFSIFGNRYDFIRNADTVIRFPENIEAVSTKEIVLDEISSETVDLQIDIGVGEVIINSTDSQFFKAQVPDELTAVESDKDRVHVSNKDNKFWMIKPSNMVYELALSEAKIWTIELNVGAVDALMNLENLSASRVVVNSGAGNYRVVLGDKLEEVYLEMNTGAGDMTVVVPSEVGVKLVVESFIMDVNFPDSTKKSENVYYSKGYDDASIHVEIVVNSAAGAISLVRE
ncbi:MULTISPECIES: LiaF domain-containing protein [unclassified Fusibacter]|uniref:LiaF domain-containing protein n=1 Tax=unclassified Fusibacter TaxID=2624464 RepID=UPI001010A941|nr:MULTISPECIES: LiaF domain-containing protein [unclassified Fusibacter]MCK8058310.1 cell wall-active antibiotics response protein [Fusibacter sp. A2]NPE20893.1 hypothetical protein [Fusibacter sp. A1]RXV63097.1 hypothetical protein DWB64_03595 [Fusibacter sp. A1]